MTDLMEHYFILNAYPEVSGLLEKISRNIPCAILSNADMPMLQSACDKNGLSSFLEAILTVDAVGINKPSPKVYQLAVERFACRKEEIAFVSSNTWDVAGAKSYGFKSSLLNSGAVIRESMDL